MVHIMFFSHRFAGDILCFFSLQVCVVNIWKKKNPHLGHTLTHTQWQSIRKAEIGQFSHNQNKHLHHNVRFHGKWQQRTRQERRPNTSSTSTEHCTPVNTFELKLKMAWLSFHSKFLWYLQNETPSEDSGGYSLLFFGTGIYTNLLLEGSNSYAKTWRVI